MSSSVHAIIVISIHAAREGGDRYGARLQPLFAISIHAAREGGDRTTASTIWTSWRFQSTPPVKAATSSSDTMHTRTAISIHAAREGGDCITDLRQHSTAAFQSTPPVKAATCPRGMNLFLHQDFNPRRP